MQDSPSKEPTVQVKQFSPKLTNKQRAFVKHLIENPKSSNTEAAAQAYNLKNRLTAGVVASENLKKPSIQMALAKYSNTVEDAIIGTVEDWKHEDNSRKREIAMQNAQYIHDKIHGKAKQSIETTTTGVTLVIDLTSSLTDTAQVK